MLPKSNTLFHFTKSVTVLQSILENGFWPRYCLEHIDPLGFTDPKYVAYPLVCFCDIPLTRIEEHIHFYGNFGLGMTRDWAHKNGLNPVMYVSEGSPLIDAYQKLSQIVVKVQGDKEGGDATRTLRELLAFNKPVSGTMIVAGEPLSKDFYQESEWRYVARSANVKDYISKNDFENENRLQERNQESYDHARLQFSPGDVRYIFVKSDSDIPGVVDFINSKLDRFPSAELKVLTSRIVSLESLHQDL